MKVTIRQQEAARMIDALIERRRNNLFPYNIKRATVPQELIPEEIRTDEELLARFYLFACVYMRGGIESHTAFRQLIKLWHDHPHFFCAKTASALEEKEIETILKRYIGWDARVASRFWKRNATQLHLHWSGSAREIARTVHSYEEAHTFIANKKSRSSDERTAGFWGFQHKMVSMLLYFFDWEGWIPTRFLYPSPADFHHYRFFLANELVIVETEAGRPIRYSEQISKLIREMLMWYMSDRNVTPVELSDALWLFSLLLCGESPITATPENDDACHSKWKEHHNNRYHKTCGVCPFEHSCRFAIPSKPYYRKGIIVLRERPRTKQVPGQLFLLPDG